MGKKRKASAHQADLPRAYDAADGKLGPVRTYEDIADSEDEFHLNRDKILLDEGPEAKRQRKWQEQDAFLEPSDEEVLGYSSDSSEDIEEEAPKSKKSTKAAKNVSDSDREEEYDEDAGGWGTSKRDYYNADHIQTEADALEEEAEAKRLQQKKLQKMSEADFGFDENEWLDAGKDGEDGDAVTEVLKDIEVTEDMDKDERLRLLNIRYPEFPILADEFLQLQPKLQELRTEAEKPHAAPTAVIKLRALAAYLGALIMYFSILTSTAEEGDGNLALDPTELREHPVMDTLLKCKNSWTKANKLKTIEASSQAQDQVTYSSEKPASLDSREEKVARPLKVKKSKKQIRLEAEASEANAQRTARIRQAEEGLADLSHLLSKPSKKVSKKRAEQAPVEDDSDFGEEETMDAREAAEKAQKKKSLRFYTSQIAQKANKRAGAGRDAGGDADLPYRERLRDRQARLQAEAEKRGKKLDLNGRGDKTALGGDSEDEDDKATAAAVRNDENDYYDMVANATKAKKAEKEARKQAAATAIAEGKLVREVAGEVGDDGKRAIGYVIEKNKGLAPKRKKEVRNPRVKKRMKYESKMKKLSSTRAVYSGGSKGTYAGELSGIKSNLVKSVKL